VVDKAPLWFAFDAAWFREFQRRDQLKKSFSTGAVPRYGPGCLLGSVGLRCSLVTIPPGVLGAAGSTDSYWSVG